MRRFLRRDARTCCAFPKSKASTFSHSRLTLSFIYRKDANPGTDITGIANWYHQAGTPVVTCVREFDEDTETYSLSFKQVLPKTPDEHGRKEKLAQLVPIKVGLLHGQTGFDLDLSRFDITVSDEFGAVGLGSVVALDEATDATTLVLSAMRAKFTFTPKKLSDTDLFGGVPPVPSLLRNFSAPVTLTLTPALTTEESLLILAHDTDPFNRWEAAQGMARGILGRCVKKAMSEHDETSEDQSVYDMTEYPYASTITTDSAWVLFTTACVAIIDDATANNVDRAWVEEALSFPGVASLVQQLQPVNPLVVYQTVKAFTKAFAAKCSGNFKTALQVCETETLDLGEPYDVTAEQVARRSFASYALRALASLDEDEAKKIDFDAGTCWAFPKSRHTVSPTRLTLFGYTRRVLEETVRRRHEHDARGLRVGRVVKRGRVLRGSQAIRLPKFP